MDFNLFKEYCIQKGYDAIKGWRYISFVNQVDKLLIEVQKKNKKFDTTQAIKFIIESPDYLKRILAESSDGDIRLNRSSFSGQKKMLLYFIDYLDSVGIIDNAQEAKTYIDSIIYTDTVTNKTSKALFKNLDDILFSIDYIGAVSFDIARKAPRSQVRRKEFKPYDSEKELLIVKSIAILSWYGYSYPEMLALKKDEIIKSDNDYYIIKSGEKVNINKRYYDILVMQANTMQYRGLPSGRLTKYYKDSEFLIRSTTPSEPTVQTISCIMQRFNIQAKKLNYPKSYDYDRIRLCSIFAKVREMKPKTQKEYVDASISLGIDRHEAYIKYPIYKQWLKLF